MNDDIVLMSMSSIVRAIRDEVLEPVHTALEMGEEPDERLLCPFFLLGNFGVGKTQIIKGIAQQLTEEWTAMGDKYNRCGFKHIGLANISELDLAGLPYASDADSEGNKQTKYAATSQLPNVANGDPEIGILMFDEICSASIAVRASALTLLDGTRGTMGYKLPLYWIVVCVGNGADDGGIYNGLENVVTNRGRTIRVDLEQSLGEWLTWGEKSKRVHPEVVSFLNFEPGMRYTATGGDFGDGELRGVGTPRTWELASAMIFELDRQFAGVTAGGADIRERKARLEAFRKKRGEDAFESGGVQEMNVAVVDKKGKKGADTPSLSKPKFNSAQEGLLRSFVGPRAGNAFLAYYSFNGEVYAADDILAGRIKKVSATLDPMAFQISADGAMAVLKSYVFKPKETTDVEIGGLAHFIEFLVLAAENRSGALADATIKRLFEAVPRVRMVLTDPRFESDYPTAFEKFVSFLETADYAGG
jgi:hypothetical protein